MAPELLETFRTKRILVIGDVMLDQFVWGAVRRISPEAPVPVVEVTGETFYPGGAANVARNVAPFTSHCSILGRVGTDRQAAQVRAILREEGVNTDCLMENAGIPTISKTRVVARQQQVVRVDRETVAPLTDDEVARAAARLREMAAGIDAVIIEDYAKGFVTQPLVDAVVEICREAGALLTVDPSPRNPLAWRGASVVKPNRLEAFAAAGVEDRHFSGPPLENPQLREVGARLLEKWGVPCVLITLGEQGMVLVEAGGEPFHLPTRAHEVYDVSGAGDTAIAIFTLALASGLGTRGAADAANHASSIVVGKLGTAALTPAELLEAMSDGCAG